MDLAGQDVVKAAADKASVSLSREDEISIRSLASELHAPLNVVAELYSEELARLRRDARVTTFLPLVVSRLVRRRSAELAETQSG
jgi:hypothetical protein